MDRHTFKDRSISERRPFVKDNKLSFNCLSKTHVVKDFKSSNICGEKNREKIYHTLLHEPPYVNVNNNLIKDLHTDNKNLEREVSYLKNVKICQKRN